MLSVTYRDHREGPGGPPGGATGPRGLRGPSVGGDQPQVSWCAPTRAQGEERREKGETLGSDGPKAHLVVRPPSPPPWPPPRWDLGLAATPRGGNPRGGAAPFPLYIVEFWGCHTHENTSLLAQPYPSPSSSLAVLGEALLECHAPPPPPRRCAAAGRSLPQPLPLPLLDQGTGDVIGLHVC